MWKTKSYTSSMNFRDIKLFVSDVDGTINDNGNVSFTDLESRDLYEMYNTWTERVLRRLAVVQSEESPITERIEEVESPVIDESNEIVGEDTTEQAQGRSTRINWGISPRYSVNVPDEVPVTESSQAPAEEDINHINLSYDEINDMLSEL